MRVCAAHHPLEAGGRPDSRLKAGSNGCVCLLLTTSSKLVADRQPAERRQKWIRVLTAIGALSRVREREGARVSRTSGHAPNSIPFSGLLAAWSRCRVRCRVRWPSASHAVSTADRGAGWPRRDRARFPRAFARLRNRDRWYRRRPLARISPCRRRLSPAVRRNTLRSA